MIENSEKQNKQSFWIRSTKECVYVAVFLAVTFAVQLALSFAPGVELVTVMIITYAFVFGVRRSVVAVTLFSVLRSIFFGFYPPVLLLYLLHFNALACVFGAMGRKKPKLWQVVSIATVCAAGLTLLDDVITPLYYAFSWAVTKTYFIASLSVMAVNCVCVAVSCAALFYPLTKAFYTARRELLR